MKGEASVPPLAPHPQRVELAFAKHLLWATPCAMQSKAGLDPASAREPVQPERPKREQLHASWCWRCLERPLHRRRGSQAHIWPPGDIHRGH